jgi:hypothetical protein
VVAADASTETAEYPLLNEVLQVQPGQASGGLGVCIVQTAELLARSDAETTDVLQE